MATGSRAAQRRSSTQSASAGEVDALLEACRSLVAISVRSLAAVSAQVDIVQLRVLVVVASRGSVSLGEAADATGITLSKASRTCDRLVGMRLLARADDPSDRRTLKLTLTPAGRRIVGRVTQARRDAITPMLDAMSAEQRAVLVVALRQFTARAEPESRDLWAMGWET